MPKNSREHNSLSIWHSSAYLTVFFPTSFVLVAIIISFWRLNISSDQRLKISYSVFPFPRFPSRSSIPTFPALVLVLRPHSVIKQNISGEICSCGSAHLPVSATKWKNKKQNDTEILSRQRYYLKRTSYIARVVIWVQSKKNSTN